MYFSLYFALLI